MRLSRWRRYAPPAEVVMAPPPPLPPPGTLAPPDLSPLHDVIAAAVADQQAELVELLPLLGPLPPGLRLEMGPLRAVEVDRSDPATYRVRFEQTVRLTQRPVE